MCDAVDPALPAGDLVAVLSLYFAPEDVPAGALIWELPGEDRELDPARPIGQQVPADALIRLTPR